MNQFFGKPVQINQIEKQRSQSVDLDLDLINHVSQYQMKPISSVQKQSRIALSKQTSSSSNNAGEIPDLVYFYSEPLVEKVWNEKIQAFKLISSGWDQLQTDIEYLRLIQILKATDKDFNIMKQAINFESLKQMIARKPKIIHISCHGDFDKETNEFYLQFEEIGNGISDRFCQSRLLELLGSESDHGIKLAFVSACHSEEIGKILFKCHIPLVISVNSESQVADEICLLFSRHLYMQLLQGHSIQKSFEEAQRTCKASPIDCKSCCCAHDHTSSCKWQKYANNNGYEKAHQLHSGKCLCQLGNNKHKKNCNLYIEFRNFLRDWLPPDSPVKEIPKENIWAFDDDFDFENFENNLITVDVKQEEEFTICCCHQEIPHDESSKFQLKAEEKNKSMILFKNRSNGGQLTQLHLINSQVQLSQNYEKSWLIGRNLEIQSCVEMLINNKHKNNKIIKIYGKSGCGRLLIAKKAAKYVMDRGYFTNGGYEIDAESTYNVSSFLQQLFQTMRLSNMNNIEDFIDLIKHREMIVIINNIHRILQNDKQKFLNLIFQINDKTEDIKLILILEKEEDIDFQAFDKTKFIRSNSLQICPLKKQFAIEFLLSQDKNNEVFTKKLKDQLKTHSIFSLVLKNLQIQDIFMLLKSGQTLDEIEMIFKSEIKEQNASIHHAKQKMYDVQFILFKSMQSIYEEEKNLLFLISQAPGGLTTKDILDIVSLHPWRYGNWAHFLDSCLFQSEARALNRDENENHQSLNPNEVKDEKKHGFQVVYQKQGEGLNENISFLSTKIREFLNEVVLVNNRDHYLGAFLRYLSKLSRQYLRNFIAGSLNDFNINILSCNVDNGFWDKIRISPLEHLNGKQYVENQSYIENVDARFTINEINFAEAFNYQVITKVFKSKQQMDDFKNQDRCFQFLDELYCCYVSILIFKNREKEALVMIEMADQICKYLNLDQTSAKLQLISISIQIKNRNIFDIQNKLANINEVFKRNLNPGGQAETHLLKSIWLICKLNLQKNKQDCINEESQLLSKGKSGCQGEMIQTQQIINELNHTQDAFRKIKSSLGEARVILMKTSFFYQYDQQEHENFESTLSDLIQAEVIFGEHQLNQHSTQCMIYISIIYLKQEKFQQAKDCIHKGLSQARSIKDNNQLQMANNILEQIQIKIQMKSNNLIICLNSFPLVSVDQQKELIPSQELNKVEILKANNFLSFDIERICIKNILGYLGKSLVYKHEILNKESLENLKNYGCRVLILKQTVFDSSCKLCIENNFGELETISSLELKQILKPKEGMLNVDVAFINIKNGMEIAKVFQELGVRQVYTYENQEEPAILNQIQGVNFYEFMGYNSIEILKNLINQQSYYRAQESAKIKSRKLYRKNFTSSLKWEGGQGNLKLFDDQSVDERQMISDGKIEDQTQELGPNNLGFNYGPFIGRKKDLHLILKDILGEAKQLIKITGAKGIGKTRLVKEVGHRIHLRKIMPNGVYYMDFQNISTQSQINDLFKQQGISFILDNEGNEQQKNFKILLIYDNVDQIQSYDTIFKWHIRRLLNFFPQLKVLMTQQIKCQVKGGCQYMRSIKMKDIRIQELNNEESVALVMMYCLRELKDSEFDSVKHEPILLKKNQSIQDQMLNQPDLIKQKSAILNDHEKILELFSNNINIQLCEGNPEALMMLALVLRSTQMKHIEVIQKKFHRQTQLLNDQSKFACQQINLTAKLFIQLKNLTPQSVKTPSKRQNIPHLKIKSVKKIKPQTQQLKINDEIQQGQIDSGYEESSKQKVIHHKIKIKNLPKINQNQKRQKTIAYKRQPSLHDVKMSKDILLEKLNSHILDHINRTIYKQCNQQELLDQNKTQKQLQRIKSYNSISQIQVFVIRDSQVNLDVFKCMDYMSVQVLQNLDFGVLKQSNEKIGILNSMMDMKKLIVDIFKQKSYDIMIFSKNEHETILDNFYDAFQPNRVQIEIPVLKINHNLKKMQLKEIIRIKESTSQQFNNMMHSFDLNKQKQLNKASTKIAENMSRIEEYSNENSDDNNQKQKLLILNNQELYNMNEYGYDSNISSVEDLEIQEIINKDYNSQELIKNQERKQRKISRKSLKNYDLDDKQPLDSKVKYQNHKFHYIKNGSKQFKEDKQVNWTKKQKYQNQNKN